MQYHASPLALVIFLGFVISVLLLSFWLASKAKSASGYFAAHGEIPWFINGIAFAGDYLSAASFLGICGMIAFYGYDGFLYSIGYLAGWIVALFVIAEPLKKLGRFTFADALDKKFNSRGIKISAAISTLVVSIFYLIPQMVGAGALIKPLLGLEQHWGVLIVGGVVIGIVATAGMVSTTWVQFIKGSLLVAFCAGLTITILARGLWRNPYDLAHGSGHAFRSDKADAVLRDHTVVPSDPAWSEKPYVHLRDANGLVTIWRKEKERLTEAQYITKLQNTVTINGKPKSEGGALYPVGNVAQLPKEADHTGPLGPAEFLSTIESSQILLWGKDEIKEASGATTTVWYQKPTTGAKLMVPGNNPLFKAIASEMPQVDKAAPASRDAWYKALWGRLDFISLMLALFCGTAALPHILIRYYTVKDATSARKSTVVGIGAIGLFYVLTLFLGFGAMTSGTLDLSDTNMSAPLLARSFGELPFACISAIAFTTVLGTVSGLIMAASGAIVHDLVTNVAQVKLSDERTVRLAKWAAVVVGAVAMWLGIQFQKMNVTFLVGWAFNIAASANLPALIMLLFWPRTTRQGITASIVIGMTTSLGWVLGSKEAMQNVYGLTAQAAAEHALVPFSQPAIVTVPLGFLALVIVSLLTKAEVAADQALREAA